MNEGIDYESPKWKLARFMFDEYQRYYVHYLKQFQHVEGNTPISFEYAHSENKFSFWELADDLLCENSELNVLIAEMKREQE